MSADTGSKYFAKELNRLVESFGNRLAELKKPGNAEVRRGGRNEATQQRRPTTLRREFRAWRAALPTALDRDTLLMPDAIAESVVQEAERFLKADLPDNFAERLAAKAHHLHPRHKHFRKGLNRPGNGGRETL